MIHTWSRAATASPATWPRIHCFGIFGQSGSAWNDAIRCCACAARSNPRSATAIAATIMTLTVAVTRRRIEPPSAGQTCPTRLTRHALHSPAMRIILPVIICGAIAGAAASAFAQSDAPADPVKTLVERLELEKYKATIKGLTQFGDRRQGTD